MNDAFTYTPPADALVGRTILVTGAGDGLGAALSEACAKLGATVVLVGRTSKKLEAVYDRIEQAGGPQAAILPLNLMTATWKDYEALAEMLEREFGRLDGLVHCAAHFKAFSRLEDIEPREWLDALQVNLTAPYTLTRQCLPLLRRSASASVVYVMDEGGRVPKPFQHVYGVSKRAAEGMMLTWAAELKGETVLRFNTVDPGPMRTALRAKGYMSEVLAKLPPPAERLSRLLWLLGDESAGVSGKAF